MILKSSIFKPIIQFLLFVCIALLGFSCNVPSPYFQKQYAIPKTMWTYDFKPDFKINVADTAAQYRMFLVIRNDEAYPYANIWFRLKVKAPGQKQFDEGERINMVLADAEGKWLGKGMGGIWEHKIPFTPKQTVKFNKPGLYELQMEQVMRMNPLPSVLNVGLIVEKMN